MTFDFEAWMFAHSEELALLSRADCMRRSVDAAVAAERAAVESEIETLRKRASKAEVLAARYQDANGPEGCPGVPDESQDVWVDRVYGMPEMLSKPRPAALEDAMTYPRTFDEWLNFEFDVFMRMNGVDAAVVWFDAAIALDVEMFFSSFMAG